MGIAYFEYHSFPDAGRSFTGNPAGVCLLDGAFPTDEVMLGIAASNKHAETAFVIPQGSAFGLRWFTPTVEVDLCGHATLAAAAALFDSGRAAGERIVFETHSGPLTVTRAGQGLVMDFPTVAYERCEADRRVLDAIGLSEVRGACEVAPIHGKRFLLLVSTEGIVSGLAPDFSALAALSSNIVVTAEGSRSDFVSRFFAPACGVDEDPVTGSAHCVLAPFWFERLGRRRMTARQIGPRPGALEVEVVDERVLLSGRAARYLSGEITLD